MLQYISILTVLSHPLSRTFMEVLGIQKYRYSATFY